MLLIEKKVIEENKEHVEYKDGSSNFVIPVEFLLTHSKEAEVVDVDELLKNWIDSREGLTYNEYAIKYGYKLIKIKQ